MLAESGDAPFNRADWMWEPKLDGYRVLAFIDEHGVKLRSRRGLELAASFPRLAAELGKQAAGRMILDGEIVAFDASGKPSFAALQDRAQLKAERDIAAADQNTPVVFYCFDLLHFAGIDLRKAPYRDRRRYLAQCLLPSPLVKLVHAAEDGVALHAAALASGFEGVIGKRKESRYEAGRRSASWLKVKPTRSADFVDRRLHQAGRARAPRSAPSWSATGTRASCATPRTSARASTSARWRRSRRDWIRCSESTCPFAEKPELNGPTTWVEPEIVAEVSFQSWTDDDAPARAGVPAAAR